MSKPFDYNYLEDCIREQVIMVIEDWPTPEQKKLREFIKGLGPDYDEVKDPTLNRSLENFFNKLRHFLDEIGEEIEPLRKELEDV